MQRCYFVFSEMAFFVEWGLFYLMKAWVCCFDWRTLFAPTKKGVVAGVKSVGADKNIRKVKIECKAVFINYTGGLYEYF